MHPIGWPRSARVRDVVTLSASAGLPARPMQASVWSVGSERDEGGGAGGDGGDRDRLARLGEIAIDIAHELRNVLQIISASAYVARHESARGNAAAALTHVLAIEKSARTAHGIVDDLMAMARSEVRFEPVLLADVLAAVRAEIPLAPTGEACARWDDVITPAHLRVRAHAGLLVRLLHTLYENAIQAAAPRPPRIETRARAAGGRVFIEVADDGPGVPADIAARVFDPLVTARPGGTGVGLALARRIAEALDGAITLVDDASAAAGDERAASQGATFRVELGDAAT
jgi:signal transduction histidine kinase